VTRGQLPQRAGSLGLNGGGAAAAVPPNKKARPIKAHCSADDNQTQMLKGGNGNDTIRYDTTEGV